MQRHHHTECDRIVGTHHCLRLHERLGKQSHGAVESALHATVSELVPFGFGGKMVRSHLRVEHGEQFRRFEGDFLAGHVCHGCDATFGQMPDHDFHGCVFVDAHHGCAERALAAAHLHDRQCGGVMFKLRGKVGLPGGQHDQTVNMAVYQRLDALNLRGLITADAQQQLLRIHVDDGFDFVKQLRTERVVGGRNHQADGVGDGAAQRARRIIDRIVEVCRGRSHAACDVVVFGAFAGEDAGDGGDGDVG